MNRSYINYWQGLGRRITNYWLLEGDSTSLNPGNSALRDPGSPFYSLPLRSFGRVHHCRLSLTWIKSGSPKESKLLACGKAILASSNRARRYASFPPRERLVKIEIHLGLAGIKTRLPGRRRHGRWAGLCILRSRRRSPASLWRVSCAWFFSFPRWVKWRRGCPSPAES